MFNGSVARSEDGRRGDGRIPDSLEGELERLRLLVVHTMDGLAEQVLGQIQRTRGIAQQTDSVLAELRRVTAEVESVDKSQVRLRRVLTQIEDVVHDLPESTWDEYAQACAQLARLLAKSLQSG